MTRHYPFKSFLIVFVFVNLLGCNRLVTPPPPKQAPAQQKPGPVSSQSRDKKFAAYLNYMRYSLAISEGQFEQAKQYLALSLKNDPDSAYLNKKMALLYKSMKDYKGALKYARRAVNLSPKDVDAQILLADL